MLEEEWRLEVVASELEEARRRYKKRKGVEKHKTSQIERAEEKGRAADGRGEEGRTAASAAAFSLASLAFLAAASFLSRSFDSASALRVRSCIEGPGTAEGGGGAGSSPQPSSKSVEAWVC